MRDASSGTNWTAIKAIPGLENISIERLGEKVGPIIAKWRPRITLRINVRNQLDEIEDAIRTVKDLAAFLDGSGHSLADILTSYRSIMRKHANLPAKKSARSVLRDIELELQTLRAGMVIGLGGRNSVTSHPSRFYRFAVAELIMAWKDLADEKEREIRYARETEGQVKSSSTRFILSCMRLVDPGADQSRVFTAINLVRAKNPLDPASMEEILYDPKQKLGPLAQRLGLLPERKNSEGAEEAI